MNYKFWIAAVVMLVVCVWVTLALSQGWPGGSVTRWMSQEQIEECSKLFDREEPRGFCVDLRELRDTAESMIGRYCE